MWSTCLAEMVFNCVTRDCIAAGCVVISANGQFIGWVSCPLYRVTTHKHLSPYKCQVKPDKMAVFSAGGECLSPTSSTHSAWFGAVIMLSFWGRYFCADCSSLQNVYSRRILFEKSLVSLGSDILTGVCSFFFLWEFYAGDS